MRKNRKSVSAHCYSAYEWMDEWMFGSLSGSQCDYICRKSLCSSSALPSFFRWIFFTLLLNIFTFWWWFFCLFFLLTRVRACVCCCLVIFVSFRFIADLNYTNICTCRNVHSHTHSLRLKTTANVFIEFTRFLLSIKLKRFSQLQLLFQYFSVWAGFFCTCAPNFFLCSNEMKLCEIF